MRRIAIVLCMLACAKAALAIEPWLLKPFNIERTAQSGGAFVAAKGQVIYSEKSFGRPGTFLTEQLPSGDWPIAIDIEEELIKRTFKGQKSSPLTGTAFAKVETLEVYCSKMFGEITSKGREKVRPTLCFKDGDGDGAFEQAITGYARVFENKLKLEFLLADIPFGLEYLESEGADIAPLHYVRRAHSPEAGKEGIVELRYGGLKGKALLLTVVARVADSATPIHERQIEVERPTAGPVEVVIEHPILGSAGYRRALGHDMPPLPPGANPRTREPPLPIPTMKIAIAKADGKSIAGTIVSAFPEWVWVRRDACKSSVLPIGLAPPGPPAAAPPPRPCEFATWRDGNSVVSRGPYDVTQAGPAPEPTKP